MPDKPPSHLRAVLQALLVTILWSTSWVLIKYGLEDIPALTFAGLRYSLAFLILLPFLIGNKSLPTLREVPGATWGLLLLLGVLFYSITQGSQFVSLAYLPAVTTSLLLSFTAPLVAFLGIGLLREVPTRNQWLGTGMYLIGILIYFYPLTVPMGQTIGLIAATVGVLANALSSVLGRHLNRTAALEPEMITLISMGSGSLILLGAGLGIQGLPPLSIQSWAIILWLAAVNSAFAFTLWNRTLRTLSAMESSIINNTMLFQIALLAWVFLGERLNSLQIGGMLLAGVGTALVQIRRSRVP